MNHFRRVCLVVVTGMAFAACGGGGSAGPGDSGGEGGGPRGGSGGAGGATGGAAAGGAGGAGGSIGGSAAGSGGTTAGAGGATGGSGGATGGSGGATGGSGGAAGGATGGTAGGGAAGTGGSAAGGASGAGATGGGGAGTGGAAGAGGTGGPGGAAGAGGSAGTAGTGGTGGTGGATGAGGAAMACGNGVIDLGEGCDDHNRFVGDGCGALCQVEAGWSCPTPGSPCILTALCGDGLLAVNEVCDDGNTQSGDGCAADCKSVDPGYDCRAPGRPCLPICGDGKRIGAEGCDDGNTTDGDGCSAVCLVEPAASCSGPPGGKSTCTKPVCGNGVQEGSEACDCGTSDTALPAGCNGPNGAFFGDASGCSRTCTKEPACRSAAGTTQACASVCGNGVIDTGEACDDGNSDPGDGCSPSCTIEAGFACAVAMRTGGEPCQGGSGQCLHLPAVIRDFKNESVSGGHPDFFYMGATVANPVTIANVQGQSNTFSFSKRYCVPDAAGPAKQQDTVNRAWDLAAATLGASGKPVFNTARTNGTLTPCQFIDWSSDGNGGHVPGYTSSSSPTLGLTYVAGPNGHPMYHGLAPMVTSADTFAQWFIDNTFTGSTHGVKTLELAAAAAGQYQFTPNPHVTYGGFFPFDPPGQFPAAGGSNGPGAIRVVGLGSDMESLQCNIWPYWFSSTQFGAGKNCRGDQYLFPPSVDGTLYPAGTWLTNVQGWFHDFWFTTEIRTTFVYTGAFKLDVAATDDFYAFINGKLVVDLGGTHQRIPAHVEVSGAAGGATIVEGGRVDPTTGWAPACPSADPYTGLTTNVATNPDAAGHLNCVTADCDCRARTADLGLQMGKTYELAMFAANRHCPEYDLDIGLSAPGGNTSACLPRCGDGLRSGNEQCDCGDGTSPPSDPWCAGRANGDTNYGGCRTDCKLAGYCGDGVVDAGTGEECDLGATNNTGGYGTAGCTPGCRAPHFCGDGVLDAWAGEQCDRGTLNGTAGSPCSVICRITTP